MPLILSRARHSSLSLHASNKRERSVSGASRDLPINLASHLCGYVQCEVENRAGAKYGRMQPDQPFLGTRDCCPRCFDGKAGRVFSVRRGKTTRGRLSKGRMRRLVMRLLSDKNLREGLEAWLTQTTGPGLRWELRRKAKHTCANGIGRSQIRFWSS